ncbi:Franean1_4349 family RiPP [Candidatus Oscillochloris fontis]|uniref:Franean1_4349 family RiPP n=1 Tax=Candidatus Oscillochloris fontis TaxID=2496868 RepID=UPI00101E15B1|nr:Franean1_4349 family RiPP [Candidatus Oscillochloris fontis]
MSQEAVQQIIGRAVTDAAFRQQLIDNAKAACKGYDLTPEELEALEALDAESLKVFAGSLDVRITKTAGKGFI